MLAYRRVLNASVVVAAGAGIGAYLLQYPLSRGFFRAAFPRGHPIDLAVGNVADGGGPFGAVVVAPSGEEFTGINRARPTAHAEVQAGRAAAVGLGTHDLAGCVLYTS